MAQCRCDATVRSSCTASPLRGSGGAGLAALARNGLGARARLVKAAIAALGRKGISLRGSRLAFARWPDAMIRLSRTASPLRGSGGAGIAALARNGLGARAPREGGHRCARPEGHRLRGSHRAFARRPDATVRSSRTGLAASRLGRGGHRCVRPERPDCSVVERSESDPSGERASRPHARGNECGQSAPEARRGVPVRRSRPGLH
jgi:hypothetical protein